MPPPDPEPIPESIISIQLSRLITGVNTAFDPANAIGELTESIFVSDFKDFKVQFETPFSSDAEHAP